LALSELGDRKMKKFNSTMDSKEIRKHVAGIKIIKKYGCGVEFSVCGEAYDISRLDRFGISACYLGAVYAERTGTAKVMLPVKMVWELAELSSPLRFDEKVLSQSHDKILEYADRLLTDSGIFNSGDKRRDFSVTFDLLGKDVQGFKEQLRLSLHWCVAFQ
jgi:hypothetical protein